MLRGGESSPPPEESEASKFALSKKFSKVFGGRGSSFPQANELAETAARTQHGACDKANGAEASIGPQSSPKIVCEILGRQIADRPHTEKRRVKFRCCTRRSRRFHFYHRCATSVMVAFFTRCLRNLFDAIEHSGTKRDGGARPLTGKAMPVCADHVSDKDVAGFERGIGRAAETDVPDLGCSRNLHGGRISATGASAVGDRDHGAAPPHAPSHPVRCRRDALNAGPFRYPRSALARIGG